MKNGGTTIFLQFICAVTALAALVRFVSTMNFFQLTCFALLVLLLMTAVHDSIAASSEE